MPQERQEPSPLVQRITLWVREKPHYAALFVGGGLALALFAAIVVSVSHRAVSSEPALIAADDADLCARFHKLSELERSSAQRGMIKQYQAALARLFTELLDSEASPDDLATLSSVGSHCDGLSNDDFAWAVAIEARLKRGLWPHKPTAPPVKEEIRAELATAIERYTALQISLPSGPPARTAWLQFAAMAQPPARRILKQFPSGTPETDVVLYDQLLAIAQSSPLLGEIYDRLGLLSQPIYVTDESGRGGGAGVPVGPLGTLPFLGVVYGEECALAGDSSPHPRLVLRSCSGLVPRRLPQGEVILLGVETRFDRDPSLHWLPVLLGDDHQVHIGSAEHVSDKLLAAFVQAAPHFTADGKPFSGDLAPVAEEGAALTFRSPLQKTQPLIVFAKKSPVKVEKKDCPKLDRDRCLALRGEGDKCDLGPPLCIGLPGGGALRVARSLVVHSEQCLHEYGEKQACPHHDTYGLFIDTKRPGEKTFAESAVSVVAESKDKPEE